MRSGFTLIETLVALIVLQFGMLALAAASAVAARDFASAHRRMRAQAMARERIESLRPGACHATGGADSSAGFDVRWSVEPLGVHRAITVMVKFAQPGRQRGSVSLRSAALCEP